MRLDDGIIIEATNRGSAKIIEILSHQCFKKISKTITGRTSFRPDCLTEMFLFAVVEYAVERNVLVMISTDYCPNLASDVSSV